MIRTFRARRAAAAWTRALWRIALAVGALAAAPLSSAHAADFPSETITLIVPYAAGGPPDVASRIIAPRLSEILGVPVVVDNRPGAATAIGTQAVVKAKPDGYTLLALDTAITVAPNILKNAGFDPQRDLAPVAPTLRSFMTLVANPKLPAHTVPELVALAKSHPGELTFGTSGLGTPPYLGALAFMQASDVDMRHVPYRGVALALNDLIGGQISVVFVSQSTAAGQVKAGTVRVLGAFGEKRIPSLPDTPTFGESGLDTHIFDEGTWFGIAAPAATPPAIVARLNDAFNKALADPATKTALEGADFEVVGGKPDELRKLIDRHTVYWKAAFEKAGVKPE